MLEQSSVKAHTVAPTLIMIRDLKVNTTIYGWLLVSQTQQRTAANGRSYLQFTLRDPSGSEIIARQFNVPVRASDIPTAGSIMLLSGQVDLYQNHLNLKLTSSKDDPSAPIELFTSGTRRPIAELEEDFWKLLHEVTDPGLAQLLNACFNPTTMERFRRWSASMKKHSAVVGGLLEHTMLVTTYAEQFSRQYPCNRDLVITGALLHDIGKLEELEEQPHAGYTEAGKLFGHIVLGVQYVQKQAEQIPQLEPALLRDLLHIILSHHGSREFGSPVTPLTIEALMVHNADMTEAKLTGFLEHCQHASPGSGWTSYHPDFGGALRIPD